MVGQPLDFTVSYREAGVTIDHFLFSTHANLMEFYSQTDLDGIFINNEWPKIGTSLAGTKAVLAWPTAAVDFVLESTSTLSPPSWNPITTPPVVIGDRNSVTVNVSGSAYYRLKKP
jgi:hypothetical protein